jgi:hypothetical protein
MGTRSLLAVYIDGAFRVAQYGHTRSDPSDQGVQLLKFLQHRDLVEFKSKVRKVQFAPDERRAGLARTDIDTFSGHHGWEVLDWIQLSHNTVFLDDWLAFAGNSLHCEWAYVIDFDAEVFEVYQGFNREQTPDHSRFPSKAMGDWLAHFPGYHPVSLVKAYDLASLPSPAPFVDEMKALCRSNKVGSLKAPD